MITLSLFIAYELKGGYFVIIVIILFKIIVNNQVQTIRNTHVLHIRMKIINS